MFFLWKLLRHFFSFCCWLSQYNFDIPLYDLGCRNVGVKLCSLACVSLNFILGCYSLGITGGSPRGFIGRKFSSPRWRMTAKGTTFKK